MSETTPTSRRAQVLLAAGFLLCAVAVRAGAVPTEQTAWGGFFCQALDDSDLDARDALNRPVRGPRARAELKDLFTATVFTLLAERELPLSATARQILEEWATPFGERFVRTVSRLGQEAAALCGSRRLFQALTALPFSLFILLHAGGAFRPCRASAARTFLSSSLSLRC